MALEKMKKKLKSNITQGSISRTEEKKIRKNIDITKQIKFGIHRWKNYLIELLLYVNCSIYILFILINIIIIIIIL